MYIYGWLNKHFMILCMPYLMPWPSSMTMPPANTARSGCDVLQDRKFSVLPWPAKSPDLNLIQHIWDLLDRRVRARAICMKYHTIFRKRNWLHKIKLLFCKKNNNNNHNQVPPYTGSNDSCEGGTFPSHNSPCSASVVKSWIPKSCRYKDVQLVGLLRHLCCTINQWL